MMKIIIVEDEDILREGIYRVGKWSEHGFEIAGLAANGEEALELIETQKPDIVLTDVVMPGMDGIELAKRIYQEYPGTKVIILSGHEEFDYAKKALEYHVYKYLLKPAKIEIIMETLLELKAELEREQKRRDEEQELKRRFQESLPVLREHYLNRIAAGDIQDEEQLETQLRFLELNIKNDHIAVMAAEADKAPEDAGRPEESGIHNIRIAEIIGEVIRPEYNCSIFQDVKNKVIMILNYSGEMSFRDNLKYLTGKAVRIQKEMERRYGKTISIGIGRPARSLLHIKNAYREASAALEYKFFMGSNSIIYIGDIERSENRDTLEIEKIENDIITGIRAGDILRVKELLSLYFQQMEGGSRQEKGFVYDEVMVFLNNLHRMLRAKGEEEKTDYIYLVQDELNELGRRKHETIHVLKERIQKLIVTVTEHINDSRVYRNRGIIENAKSYVKENLHRDVSLIGVADAVFISPNYLSFLFRENGESFKEFVTRERIAKAERMLGEGTYNLNQIALAVGYKDGRYLSQVYKKLKGKPPVMGAQS